MAAFQLFSVPRKRCNKTQGKLEKTKFFIINIWNKMTNTQDIICFKRKKNLKNISLYVQHKTEIYIRSAHNWDWYLKLLSGFLWKY